MGRKTRAAARAQEMPDDAPQTEEACTIPLPPTPSKQHERGPLSNVKGADAGAFSGDSNDMPKAKGKKGKRAGGKKKGKKGKAGTADEPEQVEGGVAKSLEAEDEAEVDDESSATSGSPVLHQGPEEDEKNGKHSPLRNHNNTLIILPDDHPGAVQADRSTSPPANVGRLTRSQIAQADAEQADTLPSADPIGLSIHENNAAGAEAVVQPSIEVTAPPADEHESNTAKLQSESEAPSVEEPAKAEADTAGPQSQATPRLEDSVKESSKSPGELQPLSTTTSITSTVPEDPIDAIDALEDAIEEVGKILPSLNEPLSPVKPKINKATSSKAKPLAKTTKPIAPSTVKDGLSKSQIGRASSVRATGSTRLATTTQPSATSRTGKTPTTAGVGSLARSSSTRVRPTSVVGSSGLSQPSKDKPEVKRRPISVQFPTPAPPAKSTKPPTKSTFSLPGEAVAAKMKAARQERLKREEEEAAKRKAFKARAAPTTIKTKPVEVKQTAASRARLSVIGGADSAGNKENSSESGLKRSSTVTGATSNSAKRGTTFGSSTSKRLSVMGPPSTSAQTGASTSAAKKRASTTFAANKDFSSSVSAPRRQSGITPNPTSKPVSSMGSSVSKSRSILGVSTSKPPTAKSVLGREQERKEKDEAMKKARAEAAERGRQASRDWAEKHKKALGEKKGGKTASPVEEPAPAKTPTTVEEPATVEESATVPAAHEALVVNGGMNGVPAIVV
jgi:hypothetical protein